MSQLNFLNYDLEAYRSMTQVLDIILRKYTVFSKLQYLQYLTYNTWVKKYVELLFTN